MGLGLYELLVFKRELVAEFGVEAGFERYRERYLGSGVSRIVRAPLAPSRDYARLDGASYAELEPAGQRFTVTPPRVIGDGDQHPLESISRAFFIASVEDAIVMAKSSIIQTGGYALGDYQDDERVAFDDRPELDAALFAVAGDDAWVLVDDAAHIHDLDEAFVALLDPRSDAFGHWVSHQLPKLVLGLSLGVLPEMPVLIDADMPPSHRESLELAIGSRKMPLVALRSGERARVKRAWFAPTPIYAPYLPVNDARWHWDFMSAAPARLASGIPAMVNAADPDGAFASGDAKIFLARHAWLRRSLVNAQEIETIAQSLGFTIVYPEELPFAEQVRIVRGAGTIVGPEGSAIFLGIYASPGTRLIILSHPFVSLLTNYTAPMELVGIDVTILTGPVVNENTSEGYPHFGFRHFADYSIDPETFARVLSESAG